MSTDTIELPDMAATFNQTLSELSKNGNEGEAKQEVKADAPKAEPSNDQPKDTSKESQTKTTDTSAETKTAKKKSALDAALDEVPTSEPVDEVQQLLESKDPNWTKARETMKKQSEELKALRETSKKSSEPDPQISERIKAIESEREQLKAENAKLRDSIVALDVKYDPEFQGKYIQGRDKLISQAAAKVESAGGDKQAFLDAMEMTGNKRSMALRDILSSIEGYEKGAIETRLGQIDVLEEEMGEVLSNSQQSLEQIRHKRELEQRDSESRVAALKDSMFERVSKELQKNGYFRQSPQDAEGAQEYNNGLSEDLKNARSLVDAPAEDIVVASLKAARFDRITTHLKTERDAAMKEVEQLRAELAGYHGSEPGFRGGVKSKDAQPYDLPMDQLFNAALKGNAI